MATAALIRRAAAQARNRGFCRDSAVRHAFRLPRLGGRLDGLRGRSKFCLGVKVTVQ